MTAAPTAKPYSAEPARRDDLSLDPSSSVVVVEAAVVEGMFEAKSDGRVMGQLSDLPSGDHSSCAPKWIWAVQLMGTDDFSACSVNSALVVPRDKSSSGVR